MIRTDRLLVCEFSHLTATPSCAIMLTLGKIGQNPILSQYGRPLYHIRLLLSIYFFQFLPGIFPGIFYCPTTPSFPASAHTGEGISITDLEIATGRRPSQRQRKHPGCGAAGVHLHYTVLAYSKVFPLTYEAETNPVVSSV